MQRLLRDTAVFYVHNLKNAPKHLEYLQKRNITKECLKDIGIGAVLLAIGFTVAYLLVRYQRNHDKKQENKNIEENKEKQENQ